ncbi:MAG: hypothetical protein LQ337_003881 [Flavoplaca oasis]|nr:MAG: hypothetical protein LQ337_003881 [Flavoplaca oasis]
MSKPFVPSSGRGDALRPLVATPLEQLLQDDQAHYDAHNQRPPYVFGAAKPPRGFQTTLLDHVNQRVVRHVEVTSQYWKGYGYYFQVVVDGAPHIMRIRILVDDSWKLELWPGWRDFEFGLLPIAIGLPPDSNDPRVSEGKSAAWQQATSSSGNSSGKSGVQELPAGDSGASTGMFNDTNKQRAPAVVIQEGTGDLTPEWKSERREQEIRHESLMMKIAILEAHFSRFDGDQRIKQAD